PPNLDPVGADASPQAGLSGDILLLPGGVLDKPLQPEVELNDGRVLDPILGARRGLHDPPTKVPRVPPGDRTAAESDDEHHGHQPPDRELHTGESHGRDPEGLDWQECRVGGWRGTSCAGIRGPLIPLYDREPAASFSIRPPPNRACSRVGG